MKYLKLYENFQKGNETFVIMDKDRKHYLSNADNHQYSNTITLYTIDNFEVAKDFQTGHQTYKSKEDAQKVLDKYKNVPQGDEDPDYDQHESQLINYCIRINPWQQAKNGNSYFTEHIIYSHYTRREIINYIKAGNIDGEYPDNYPDSHKKSTNANMWQNYYFPCYNMAWDDEHVMRENAKGKVKKDIAGYDRIMDSLEVVPLFIGAYETDGLNI